METEFIIRNFRSNDWATLFFIVALVIIAYNRWVYTVQFSDFTKLLFSNKYIKVYREETNLKSWFTLSMTFVQFLSLSFLIHIFLSNFSNNEINNLRHFLQILNVLSFLILSKYIVEKIVAICFNLEEFIDQYSLVKVNYRSFIGLLLLPVAMIFFYNTSIDPMVLYAIGVLIVLANVFIYSMIIKIYQKYIGAYFYYFILYLCTFEIAPYYILYKWYLNSGF